MVKNGIAVVAGYLVWTVIFLGGAAAIRAANPGVHDEQGITSDVTTLVIYLVISVVASLAAGLLAGKLSGESKMTALSVLAVALLATGIPVQLSAWDVLPVWYNLVFLILLAPVTFVGAMLLPSQSTPSMQN